MFKGGKIKYFSQLFCFPWEAVAKTSCGLTSATMAISYFLPDISPMEVFKTACKLHSVPANSHNYWLEVNNEGDTIQVPIGQRVSRKMEDYAKNNNFRIITEGACEGRYEPVYSISNGYDHRGSERLFGQFGVKANKVGDFSNPVEQDEFIDEINNGNMFLVSVSNRNKEWKDFAGGGLSTHVILIYGIDKSSNEFVALDPYSEDNCRKILLIPVKGGGDIEFNGFGTIVYV